ncbi:MAG TPA: hypothetical protein VGM03_08800 [Phycisphaerae bacterium]|jgi:hypothetical protein
MPTKGKTAPRRTSRTAWLTALNGLADDITRWSREQRWLVQREQKEIREERLGTYSAPYLIVQTPQGRFVVDSIGQSVIGASGRVDLYAWPSFHRVRLLLRQAGTWKVRTDSGIDWPKPWNRETFVQLVKDLVAAE